MPDHSAPTEWAKALIRAEGFTVDGMVTINMGFDTLYRLLDAARAAGREEAAKVADNIEAALLNQIWHKDCEIIEGYMPPYPRKDTLPSVVVRYKPDNQFLRHSRGPRQGHNWDIYGDDYQTRALAVLALHHAEAPLYRALNTTAERNET